MIHRRGAQGAEALLQSKWAGRQDFIWPEPVSLATRLRALCASAVQMFLCREIEVRRQVGVVLRIGGVLVVSWPLELPIVAFFFVDGDDGFAAFDLMIELVLGEGGVFDPIGDTTSLAVFFDSLLPLHLRRLEDGSRERVNLRHRSGHFRRRSI